MACSKIIGPAPSYPIQLSQPCCRSSSLAGSFKGLPLKQSLFLGGASFLRELLLRTNSRSVAGELAYLPALRVVNAQNKQVISDSKIEGNVLKSSEPRWDGTKALAAAEGFCIVVAAASYTTSVFRDRQAALVASSSAGESKFLINVGDLSTWYVPALWAALVINAILRTLQLRSSTQSTQEVREETSMNDPTLDRVRKLEEDVQGVVNIAQMLARHLEKLGVRFRELRRTLRDPIQETVVLSQKTSEVVQALASREQVLENELEETQRVLVAMQAQQAKQLELLVAGMTKSFQSQQASEQRIKNDVSRRLGQATYTSKESGSSVSTLKEKGGAPANGRKQKLKDIGTLWKGLVPNLGTSNSKASSSQKKGSSPTVSNVELKEEHSVDKENGYARVTPRTEDGPTKQSTYSPDTSFTKEDFWATAIPRESSPYSASSQTVRQTDNQPQTTSEPQSRTSQGKLDSFFNSKKRVHIPEDETLANERDFSDPGLDQLYSQSGEQSSNRSNVL